MFKKTSCLFCIAIPLLLGLMTACSLPFSTNHESKISLAFPRVGEVDKFNEVLYWQVKGTGPNRAQFNLDSIPRTQENITVPSLRPGIWTITVNGFTNTSLLIWQGSAIVNLTEGESTPVTITLLTPNLVLDPPVLQVPFNTSVTQFGIGSGTIVPGGTISPQNITGSYAVEGTGFAHFEPVTAPSDNGSQGGHLSLGSQDLGTTFTLSFWFAAHDPLHGHRSQTLVSTMDRADATGKGFRLSLNTKLDTPGVTGPADRKIILQTSSGTAASLTTLASDAEAFTPTTWNHLVLTMDKTLGTASIYLNGVEMVSGSIGTDFPTLSDLYLGTNYDTSISGGLYHFAGLMDDFRIYNSVIPPSGVTQLYTTSKPSHFAGGSGSIADPYQVSSPSELFNMRFAYQANFIQTADISLGGYGPWDPIGDIPYPFKGSFNGDHKSIDGLYISRPTQIEVGLFGRVQGAVLKNIRVTNANVTGQGVVGAIVGLFTNTYGVEGAGLYTSSSSGQVSAPGGSSAGGLIGYMQGMTAPTHKVTLDQSYSSANVTSANFAGGLVGDTMDAIISNSYAIGSVHATSGKAGGLLGRLSSTSTLSTSYFGGFVNSIGAYGGLLGEIGGSVTDSYYGLLVGETVFAGTEIPTQAALTTQGSYSGFDFATIWVMSGGSLPYLRHQGSTDIPIMVSLNFNNNSGEATGTPLAVQGFQGGIVGLPVSGTSRPYYVLDGWNTTAAGDGTFYPIGSPFTLPGTNTTLYAVWRDAGLVARWTFDPGSPTADLGPNILTLSGTSTPGLAVQNGRNSLGMGAGTSVFYKSPISHRFTTMEAGSNGGQYISFWLFGNSLSTGTLLSRTDYYNGELIWAIGSQSGSSLDLTMMNSGMETGVLNLSPTSLYPTSWNHIGILINPQSYQIRAYVNGYPVGNGSLPSPVAQKLFIIESQINIGARPGATLAIEQTMGAYLADVSMYNTGPKLPLLAYNHEDVPLSDSSGNGLHPETNTSTASNAFFKRGAYSSYFIGGPGAYNSGTYIQGATGGVTLSSDFSVSLWFMSAAPNGSYTHKVQTLVSNQTGTGAMASGFSVQLNSLGTFDQRIRVTMGDGTNGKEFLTPVNSYVPTVWNHLAVVFQGTNAVVYLNGTALTTTMAPTGTLTAPTHNGSVRFGSTYSGNYYYDGYMDDMRIFKHALSAAEIMDIKNQVP